MEKGDILTTTNKTYFYMSLLLYKIPENCWLCLGCKNNLHIDANDCLLYDDEILLSVNNNDVLVLRP